MNTGERIQKLRKLNNMTQENLADYLKISRQSISKWEANLAYPETDKLIKLAELFQVNVDYLLRGVEANTNTNTPRYHYEYKSKRTFCGLPLIHINIGRGIYKAKGVIAIGNIAKGFIAIGLLSMGILSIGVLTLGLIALGLFSLGGLSVGSIALGIFAVGAIACGIFSIGAIAIGYFSVGALSVAKYVAIGDNAYADIALGMTKASGTIYESYSGIENTYSYDKNEVIKAMNEHIPRFWTFFKKIIEHFI
jgi:transcriptional regulator with XRE-family HTH domain